MPVTRPAARFVLVSRWVQLVAPFVTAVAVFTMAAAWATLWQGAWLGALLAGVGSAGGVAASALSQRLRPLLLRREVWVRRGLPVVWSAVQAVLVLALWWRWPVAVAVVASLAGGVLLGLVSVYRRQEVAAWPPQWMRLAGPAGRVGAAAGAFIGSFVVVSGSLWLLPVLLTLPLLAPIRVAAPPRAAGPSVPARRVRRAAVRNFLFAFLACGPVAAMPALVTATLGPQWIGPSMAVYAVGALVSPALVRMFPRRAPRSTPALLAVGTLANGAWLLVPVFAVPGLLVCRVFGGVALFAAEGSLDEEAAELDAFGSALAARGVGLALAGVLAGALLATSGAVSVTLSVLTVLSLLGVAAVVLLRRFSPRLAPLPV